uniref:DUF2868 domain-containing protein n=1 Tax=Candidatus Electrothrix sp. TaxID=2170559 RepID=UPI0040566422
MKKKWTITDLIDLEFFLSQDEGEDLEKLAARDRKIYSDLPSAIQEEKSSPSVLLRSWLSSRQKALSKATGETALPGQTWKEVLCFFFGAALLSGLFSGGGLAFSFLSYSGKEPVNVAAYFAVFVLAQVLLFLILACSALFRRLQGSSLVESSLLYRLLRYLFTGLLHKVMTGIQKRASRKISGETRLKWSNYTNSFKQIRLRYGLLFLRPFFLIVQIFGVSFNVGVLAATLFKVIGADLAFGWQSTLQVTPASVSTLVHWVALPWSWLPNTFIPDLSQIEGSRLVLKDGIYHLANADLTSWWPFLCLSVLCYGLLPRLCLLLIVKIQQYRNLTRLDFQQGCFRPILHRMQTPQVSTAARLASKAPQTIQPASPKADVGNSFNSEDNSANTGPEQATPHEGIKQSADTHAPLPPIIALIPEELLPECTFTDLQQQVRSRLSYMPLQLFPFWTLEHDEDEELAALHTVMEQEKSKDVLVLLEAWQPPIEELFSWLKLLRQSLGPDALIFLALIGKPHPETILTPVQPQHLQTWQLKTTTLNDPGLQLIELVKP